MVRPILRGIAWTVIIGSHLYFVLGGAWSESFEFLHNLGNVAAGLYLIYSN